MEQNRREFLKTSVLAASVGALRVAQGAEAAAAGDGPLRVGSPVLEAPAETSVGVAWSVGTAEGVSGAETSWKLNSSAPPTSEYAAFCGVLTVTLETDYARPADEEQIWSIWNGNARVKR